MPPWPSLPALSEERGFDEAAAHCCDRRGRNGAGDRCGNRLDQQDRFAIRFRGLPGQRSIETWRSRQPRAGNWGLQLAGAASIRNQRLSGRDWNAFRKVTDCGGIAISILRAGVAAHCSSYGNCGPTLDPPGRRVVHGSRLHFYGECHSRSVCVVQFRYDDRSRGASRSRIRSEPRREYLWRRRHWRRSADWLRRPGIAISESWPRCDGRSGRRSYPGRPGKLHGGRSSRSTHGPFLSECCWKIKVKLYLVRQFNSIWTIKMKSAEVTAAQMPAHASPCYAPWPHFESEEIEAVNAVLRSGKVNYWTGEEGRQFENEFARSCGTNHAICVANGTVALELALQALDIGPGDEVITTARTFIASASCAVTRGALPVCAEVDRDSQNVTAETIERAITPRTK